MAWGFISELPVTPEQYDALNAAIGDDPKGLILHTASRSQAGMRIIDVWESEEDYRRFQQEALMPALERLGLAAPGGAAPEATEYEIHNMRRPAA